VRPLRPGDPERVGAYRLLARLGAGGMGVVYLARSPGGRAVAVKVIRERFAADAHYRARFRREVAAARAVTGVYTAPVLDADPEDTAPWLVTAYLPGLSLRDAVETAGALPANALRVLAAGLAEALVDIHRVGLVHRDLKPGNVMLTADGPRVVDFGIARPEDATAITRVGALVGTPGFMSPEQVSGAVVGPASDIFSFGALLAYAATGREPFGSDATLATLYRVLHVETDLTAITEPWPSGLVAGCLRAEPGTRPSAAEVLDWLDAPGADPGEVGGWLPAPLVEEIDRRAGQARRWHEAPDAAVPDPAAEPALMTEETLVPPAIGRAADAATRAAPRLGRRHLLVGGVAALTVAAGGVALVRGRDRPLGRTSRAGPTPSAPPTATAPVAPPRAVSRWRFKVSDYYPEELFTTGGVVVAKTPEAEMHAFDARTGRRLWKHPATLVGAVVGGRLFEAQNTNPRLALLDPVSGAKRWAYRVPFREVPVRLAVGRSVVCYGHDRIRALGLADGRSRWTRNINAELGLVAIGGLLVAASETEMVALDERTGRPRWTCPMDYVFHLSVGGGMLFVVDRHRALHAIRAGDGTTAWHAPAFGGGSTPQPGAGVLYASGGRGEILALRSAAGEVLWSRPMDHDTVLHLAGGTLYAASTDKTVYALDTTDGGLLWTYGADVVRRPMLSAAGPVSAAGQVFVGVREGYVIALPQPGGGPRAGT
jgi:outer membrane protein assembly factor BamB